MKNLGSKLLGDASPSLVFLTFCTQIFASMLKPAHALFRFKGVRCSPKTPRSEVTKRTIFLPRAPRSVSSTIGRQHNKNDFGKQGEKKRRRIALYSPPNRVLRLNRMQSINWRREPLSTAPPGQCGKHIPRVDFSTKRERSALSEVAAERRHEGRSQSPY